MVEALNAALTSWPSVEFVRIERRWRGLKAQAVEASILLVVCGGGKLLVVCVVEVLWHVNNDGICMTLRRRDLME